MARIPRTTIMRRRSDANKVVEKVVADYFSGLNFGFIGSHGAQSEQAGKHDWKLAFLDLVWQQAEWRRPRAAAAERRLCRRAAEQPRLLQCLCRLSEQQQRPGDGRLWLSLHRPARESFGVSRRQHDPDDDHPARRFRVPSVGMGHHRPLAEYADVRGPARRPHPVLDAHGHRRRNGDFLGREHLFGRHDDHRRHDR